MSNGISKQSTSISDNKVEVPTTRLLMSASKSKKTFMSCIAYINS